MRKKKDMQLDDVLGALPNFVFWKNKQLVYLGCNDHAAKLLGLNSRKDIIGKTDKELPWAEHYINQVIRYDTEVIENNLTKTDIGEVLCLANGKVVEVITDRKPIYNDEDVLEGILIISVESKKRNLADQTFFEHILKSLPYYIFWKNKGSVYLGCNDNFAKLVGKNSSKDIIGLTDFDLGWGQGEAELFREADQKIMGEHSHLNEKQYLNVEEYLNRPDGSHIVMLVSKVPVRNKNGDTIGMLGISVDITELKNAEHELKIAKNRAEIANQAKSDFIASMSHDLRTPLNAILGMADILRIKRHHPEQIPLIESITRAGKNLLGLIEDVLNFARIEAGKLELHSEPFDLLQLIEEVVGMVSHQANQKKLKLITSYADEVPRYVISDPNAIRRIIINLLGNAIKFTEQGHILISVETIKTSNHDITLQIIIEDTGIGIPQEKLEFVFDRFSRVEPSYKSKYEGTGLGLTIVKELTKNLGGDIKVKSQISKGSTFYCILPFKLQKFAKYSTKSKSPFSHLRILIVDDYQSRAKILAKQLNTTCKIVSGQQCIKNLEKYYKANNPFDIVLIDDEILNMDPYQLAEQIRKLKKFNNVMLLLFTRPLSLPEIEKANNYGFIKLFVKPVQPTEIINGLTESWELWTKDHAANKSAKFTNKQVLLVEDDALSQIVCKTFLEELGCKVDIADCGKKAIMLAEKYHDIIFMDIGLGDISGISVTQVIREKEGKEKRTPIIALTAHVSKDDEENCIIAGIDGFLTKPTSYEQIEKILTKFIQN